MSRPRIREPRCTLFIQRAKRCGGFSGSTWRACRRRGAQKSKMDGRWLRIVLRCWSDVVELDLSFKTRVRLSFNSSGVLRTRSRSVFGPFGARGRVSGALSGRFWAHFSEVPATIEAPFLRHMHTWNRRYAISYIRFSIDFCYICKGVRNQRFCASRCTNRDPLG